MSVATACGALKVPPLPRPYSPADGGALRHAVLGQAGGLYVDCGTIMAPLSHIYRNTKCTTINSTTVRS